jgi:hypothetical protein
MEQPADETVHKPIVQAVMIGLAKKHSITFVSPATSYGQQRY